jgi:hypothetical protein
LHKKSSDINHWTLISLANLFSIYSYVAFFHNMGQGTAAGFPEFPELPELLAAEKAIIKHLSAQDDVSLYTLI